VHQLTTCIENSSCRRRGDKWIVAMNRWQDLTDMEVNAGESYGRILAHLACKSRVVNRTVPFRIHQDARVLLQVSTARI
jgi:hypothetical protein